MNRHLHRHFVLVALLATALLTGCATAPRQREATLGERIAASALAQQGRPYLHGGNTPAGFDCSGLVRYAYMAAGISVPRTTTEQFNAAHQIKLAKLAPGDLLFFRLDKKKVEHVAIYTGDGRFVHAPQSGRFVESRSLDDEWYRDHLIAAGRLY
jgi:cell wall-associated NlpC family hydrolase